MLAILFLFIFLVIGFFISIFGITIVYHLKKFSLPEDKNAKKILYIFQTGGLFLLLLNISILIILIFNLLKQ